MSHKSPVPKCSCPFHIQTEFRACIATYDAPRDWQVFRETYSPVVEGTTIYYRHFVGVRELDKTYVYVVACTNIQTEEYAKNAKQVRNQV